MKHVHDDERKLEDLAAPPEELAPEEAEQARVGFDAGCRVAAHHRGRNTHA